MSYLNKGEVFFLYGDNSILNELIKKLKKAKANMTTYLNITCASQYFEGNVYYNDNSYNVIEVDKVTLSIGKILKKLGLLHDTDITKTYDKHLLIYLYENKISGY